MLSPVAGFLVDSESGLGFRVEGGVLGAEGFGLRDPRA